MKILVLTGHDPRRTYYAGGVRTYNLNLIKIAEMLGYRIEFYETKNGSNLLKLNSKVYKEYDIIIINVSVYDKGFIKLIYELMRVKNKKIIVQCHGGSFHTLRFKKLYEILFKKILNKKVNLFLVLNEEQKQSLKDYFVDSDDKIALIPNYAENTYNINMKKYNGKLGFLYVGRIVEEKGIFDFAEAFMEIKDSNIEFNVVGSGPDENRLIELTKKDKRIIFHGKLFGKEKDKIFQENHIFVFLTNLPEGFPISVLEAMSYGMCILSSRFSNSNKLVMNNYNGFIVAIQKKDIKEKIEYLIINRDCVNEYGVNSKRMLEENYSLEKQGVRKFEEIFNKVLE